MVKACKIHSANLESGNNCRASIVHRCHFATSWSCTRYQRSIEGCSSFFGNNRYTVYINGGFLKWGYPQIIHFNRIFHYKQSSYWGSTILGIHHFEKPPNGHIINGRPIRSLHLCIDRTSILDCTFWDTIEPQNIADNEYVHISHVDIP